MESSSSSSSSSSSFFSKRPRSISPQKKREYISKKKTNSSSYPIIEINDEMLEELRKRPEPAPISAKPWTDFELLNLQILEALDVLLLDENEINIKRLNGILNNLILPKIAELESSVNLSTIPVDYLSHIYKFKSNLEESDMYPFQEKLAQNLKVYFEPEPEPELDTDLKVKEIIEGKNRARRKLKAMIGESDLGFYLAKNLFTVLTNTVLINKMLISICAKKELDEFRKVYERELKSYLFYQRIYNPYDYISLQLKFETCYDAIGKSDDDLQLFLMEMSKVGISIPEKEYIRLLESEHVQTFMDSFANHFIHHHWDLCLNELTHVLDQAQKLEEEPDPRQIQIYAAALIEIFREESNLLAIREVFEYLSFFEMTGTPRPRRVQGQREPVPEPEPEPVPESLEYRIALDPDPKKFLVLIQTMFRLCPVLILEFIQFNIYRFYDLRIIQRLTQMYINIVTLILLNSRYDPVKITLQETRIIINVLKKVLNSSSSGLSLDLHVSYIPCSGEIVKNRFRMDQVVLWFNSIPHKKADIEKYKRNCPQIFTEITAGRIVS